MSNKLLPKRNEQFPSVFDDFFKPWNEWFDTSGLRGSMLKVPAVNVTEDANYYSVNVAAPGMSKNDFKIDLEGNMLSISCEKEDTKEENEKQYTRKEYNYSSFSRSFTLPENVIKDKIEATYEDGVLGLRLPKSEESKKASLVRRVVVK